MDNYSVAVDVGGTFTDVVLCNLDTNQQSVFKTPSTPDDPSAGFLTGLRQILEVNGVKPAQVKHIFHGTTIATNAILENKGSRVGVLVPEGFKYVLEIGRHGTPRLVNPNSWIKPERPVRPRDIEEIPERVSSDGEILIPLDETAVRRAARRFRDEGILSIAVSFLHSYANRDHESRARELILEEFPNAQVSLSSEVLAVFREYERTITTVLNAYVMPRVSTYLGNLEQALEGEKVDSTVSIMKSNGGIVGSSVAVRQPVHTALSGPAAGVMATLQIAESTGVLNCISFDMGGTSTDVSLIKERHPTTNLGGNLGDWPIQLPMLDIVTIGCGGGSIAAVSASGGLSVGPASAGAVPGPVCYGKGGEAPTVTDANLVLGRINTQIAGGILSLDGRAAAEAIQQNIASPLGLDQNAAANGILKIANNTMVGAIRNISVERGHDPKDFALVAYGGAGPMHAIDVAALLGINRVVVPLNPGIASAFGLLAAEFKNDYARTFLQQAPGYDLDGIELVYSELEAEGRAWLNEEGVPRRVHAMSRSADLRYAHQGSEVTVPLSGKQATGESMDALIQEFHAQHQQLYGFSLDQPVEIVTLRVTVSGDVGSVALPRWDGVSYSAEKAILDRRQVYFDQGNGFVPCNIYSRDQLSLGASISGPAILEGMDSTVVINPGWTSLVDDCGNCIIRPD
ncbi:MAG TPA: hydantoinase/oxoprolinase family protein [Dehalococcoidia bacterium]|jgi:N-methylhydantoinase A|nr:hydantoinase/oxoprolinase family protein [Dehalococcoidia bacterium]HIM48156.1 hydantoinase/oxoprolinase family protein [Dehalococcoidia bacterium]|tara:strand:+ start:219 stop:2273 length:2055 start_codon:yes stop_codon:yes gene_type:complete